MNGKRIEGYTRILGEDQGYLGLAIRDAKLDEDGSPVMISAWEPTKAEIAAMVMGASVYLFVLGTSHPPVRVEVQSVQNEP